MANPTLQEWMATGDQMMTVANRLVGDEAPALRRDVTRDLYAGLLKMQAHLHELSDSERDLALEYSTRVAKWAFARKESANG